MIEIGKNHLLRILKDIGTGLYLAHEEDEEPVFLPNKYAPRDWEVGDELKVFVYKDSQERLVATNEEPKIKLNKFAYLRVKELSKHGAFLDWGLEKDLFVPHRQQAREMLEGHRYIVYMFLDEHSDRLVGSTKYNRFLEENAPSVKVGEKVDLLITERTEIGVNVIVNHRYKGLLYKNELFKDIRKGDRQTGYVKHIREDGKIDVSLQQQGYGYIQSNAQLVLDKITRNDGFLALTDKSSPEEIALQLEMSKKAFKKTIGALYKQRKIRLATEGIYLIDRND